MNYLGLQKPLIAVLALVALSGIAAAQQPGSPQYNSVYLPAHGAGDTRQPNPIDRWGAFAVSKTNKFTGFVSGERSEASAEQAAITMCRERGGGECVTEFTVINSCSAVASSSESSSWAIRDSLRSAERAATKICGSGCSILWSACSVARRGR